MLGGKVEVQSSPGSGTSFSISLPIEAGAPTMAVVADISHSVG
jgi:signal transduction histidine kinase